MKLDVSLIAYCLVSAMITTAHAQEASPSSGENGFPMQVPPDVMERLKNLPSSPPPPPPPGYPGGHVGGQPQFGQPPPYPTGGPGAGNRNVATPPAELPKSDKAAEKAREKMRQALRESAKEMQRTREEENFKGKKKTKSK